jgi:DNA-binding NarL/FixJ family response regulator
VIRALLVDDQSLLRKAFRLILEAEPNIEVIGEAADGATGISMTSALHPDAALMDVGCPAWTQSRPSSQLPPPGRRRAGPGAVRQRLGGSGIRKIEANRGQPHPARLRLLTRTTANDSRTRPANHPRALRGI